MSFRKRSEVLGAPGGSPRVLSRGAGPNRTPQQPPLARGITPRDVRSVTGGISRLSVRNTPELSPVVTKGLELDASHPGIRPSPATSQPATSTGCRDLDKTLGHMGLPIGQTLLIQEQGTTDFSSVLVKCFAAQGIVHNRVEGSNAFVHGNTHLVVLTLNQFFAKELPGVYQGSRKDVKRSKVSLTESKITVQNTLESGAAPKDLKIAWRYGLNDDSAKNSKRSEADLDTYPNYSHAFDITSRLVPAPTSAELTLISPNQPLDAVLSQLQTVFQRHDKKLIRVVVPNLLHPVMYSPEYSQLPVIVPLLHGIRSIIKKNSERAVLISTMSSDLYSKSGSQLVTSIENMFDAAIDLEPFPQEMSQFLERVYKSQPQKIQHGLVHLMKLPLLSDRGEMHVRRSEYAFRNGKKKFEIEAWGIPIDDSEVQESKGGIENSDSSKSQTTVSLDF
ncbi:Elongator subunit ELP4 [Lachancea thermotolerans CBS 6340]|uniref:Elongator complex protein 4 n=1 Tax=Lachancea thermotolerans (strain ATCC 56472 / CBS 6340 / NRRL Y-8284) TaxID=559295 RepID=C5DIL4_LACTC|nr:KLTH0E13442p [Lachancea thermotolerans CBS 6340]CAR23625.1 KLTH0E13442p [Lachancea thermotolerans CBS 6340]